jgi:predicted helicase
MTFNHILDKYRKLSHSERDKGDRFERLMQGFLMTDPTYATQFKKVWLWNEFPGRKDLGGSDTGIDLVALTHAGDFWAIQCKCVAADSVVDKRAVDSFLATSGRSFQDENHQTATFAHCLWISTSAKPWGANANEAILNQNPPVNRIGLSYLADAPVDWEKLDKGLSGEAVRKAAKKPLDHQKIALAATHTCFETADRGKLIMACGTGKTLTALWIAEQETQGKGLILFLVPSIALLGQTLREWSANAKEPINAICICSDPKISVKRSKDADADLTSVVDLAWPASTDVRSIVRQFQAFTATDKQGMTVVFSTYQSIGVIAEAQRELLRSSGLPVTAGEAQRTAMTADEEAQQTVTTDEENRSSGLPVTAGEAQRTATTAGEAQRTAMTAGEAQRTAMTAGEAQRTA